MRDMRRGGGPRGPQPYGHGGGPRGGFGGRPGGPPPPPPPPYGHRRRGGCLGPGCLMALLPVLGMIGLCAALLAWIF